MAVFDRLLIPFSSSARSCDLANGASSHPAVNPNFLNNVANVRKLFRVVVSINWELSAGPGRTLTAWLILGTLFLEVFEFSSVNHSLVKKGSPPCFSLLDMWLGSSLSSMRRTLKISLLSDDSLIIGGNYRSCRISFLFEFCFWLFFA